MFGAVNLSVAVVCRENDLDKYQNDMENYYGFEKEMGKATGHALIATIECTICMRSLALRFSGIPLSAICIRISYIVPTKSTKHKRITNIALKLYGMSIE